MSRTVYYDWQGNEIEPPKADPVPVTNADRIRQMSDEELAEWIANFETRCYLRLSPLFDCNTKNFTKQILGWLKSPVEVDNGK